MNNNSKNEIQKNERLMRKLDLVALTERHFEASGFKPNSQAVRLCLLSIHKDIREYIGQKLGSISSDDLYQFIKAAQEQAKKDGLEREQEATANQQPTAAVKKPAGDQQAPITPKVAPSGKTESSKE